MWQADFLITAFALGSLCLAIIPKASFTSKKSNAGRHLGSLDIGTTPILNKSRESNGTTSQAGFEDAEGYQSDQPASAAWHELVVSKIRKLNPTVSCDGDTMTLSVQGHTIPNFLIDGDHGPVPLLQIPENCGFSFTQAPTQAAFTVHYHGCHVTQQGDDYVLLLRLWGISMKMSCPMAIYTHNVSCRSSGMVTKLDCDSASVLKLKVNGKWDPFIPASRTCGITTESETDGVVLSAPYQSSCWQIKGDERFLSVLYGNEELTLSCPDSNDFYIYGRVETISDQSHEPDVVTSTARSMTTGPASDSEQPQEATSSLTTTVPTITSTRKTVGMSPFLQRYSPFGPMLYQHKPKPYGYPWAFPSKPPTTTTTTSQGTDTTVATTVARNPEQPQYPFPQMYYPYGAMPYHYNPRHYGYPWAFPPKAPTTAPTRTSSKVAATTVARNPEQPQYPFPQMYYPYGAMPNHYKPRPYGYPWAFPSKPPTTASTTTTSPTTSQDTETTATTVPRNPEQPQYPFPQMYYPYGPMPYHYKPRPYGYPWAFLSKPPTTAPTTLSPTTSQNAATTAATVARNTEQPQYPFPQMYYPYGAMPNHYKPRPYGYPWAFPSKPPTTASTTTTSPTTSQDTDTTATTVPRNPEQPQYPFPQMYYPYGPMPYHYKPRPYGYPWAFLSKPPTTAPTTLSPTTSQDAATTAATVARNPEQPQYPFPQMYYPYGAMPNHYKPRPYGYPWAFPSKPPTTASTTTTSPTTSQDTDTTATTVPRNPEQPQYPFPQMYYPYGPMPYHYKPRPYGYPWAFLSKPPTTAPPTLSPTTSQDAATTATTVPQNPEQPQYPVPQMYYPYGLMPYNQKPVPYGYPWTYPEKAPATTAIKITPTTAPVTASQTSATVLNSVANDPYQSGYPSHHMYSPFGPMHCHHGPSEYHGYPFAFPAKVFTTAPNILASTTKTATARNVATTATPPIIASNRQQLSYPFYPTSSPFGPMLYHPKPMSFGHPWAFLPQEHQLLPKG